MTSSSPGHPSKEPKLPQPGPPVRPDRPFVGNETVEDNLAEAIQIAAWNAIGSAKCRIDFDVQGHAVTLRGQLETAQQRQALETAIFAVSGIQIVVNRVGLEAADPTAAAAPQEQPALFEAIQVAAEPIAYATRFCSFDEASLSAAIRDAIAALDKAFASQGLPLSRELIVTYLNHRHGTVTLQIGMPSRRFAGVGEFHVGPGPSGRMAAATVAPGHHSIEAAHAALLQAVAESGQHAADCYWQRFDETAFRPWAGHPAAEIFVPITEPAPV